MNEQLIKFIELCLSDGVITDKEREVIFRKSKELGVPEDECEIILDSMIFKNNDNKKDSNNTEESIDETSQNEIKVNNEKDSKQNTNQKHNNGKETILKKSDYGRSKQSQEEIKLQNFIMDFYDKGKVGGKEKKIIYEKSKELGVLKETCDVILNTVSSIYDPEHETIKKEYEDSFKKKETIPQEQEPKIDENQRILDLLNNSKEYFFKKQTNSFLNLPFSVKLKNSFFLKENILKSLRNKNFYIYQYGNLIYGYRGLIGRISPILVHISLITILIGSSWGAFNNFKAQEILPKGEIFRIQNLIKVGKITTIPDINTRINDFWVEYKNDKIYQFYSNVSILDSVGNEIKQQTISVNNPLRYNQVDFYQSDWNLIGIRVQDQITSQIYELPLFNLKGSSKSWVTWIIDNNNKIQTLVFDQLQNKFIVYDENGIFSKTLTLGEAVTQNLQIVDIIPATGLQIKYDPSIPLIYLGFGLLMLTALLSYLPYTQIWIFEEKNNTWLGSTTNRGKITLEIEFENLVRKIEESIVKNIFVSKIKS